MLRPAPPCSVLSFDTSKLRVERLCMMQSALLPVIPDEGAKAKGATFLTTKVENKKKKKNYS